MKLVPIVIMFIASFSMTIVAQELEMDEETAAAVSSDHQTVLECDPYQVAVTTTPIPPQLSSRLRDNDNKLANMPKSADVVMIGDSQINRWPQDMAEDLFGTTVYNYGLSGDLTQNTLWRLQQPSLNTLEPKLVVIMLGGGNLVGSSSCAVAIGVNRVVESVRQIWPNSDVLKIDITPRGTDFILRDEKRVESNEMSAAMFQESDAIYRINVDTALTCGLYRNLPFYYGISRFFSKASPCAFFQDDLTHLTSDGYSELGIQIRSTFPHLTSEN